MPRKQFPVVLSPEEHRMLSELAEAAKMTRGEWLRDQIQRRHKRKFGEAKNKK